MTRGAWAAVAVLACAVPAWADDATPGEVFAVLDGAADPASAAKALRERGVAAPVLVRLLRDGRTYGVADRQTQVLRLRAAGAETTCEVLVPAAYDPAKKWPVLLALHGLGGDSQQMTAMLGSAVDRDGFILVAPTATAPSDVEPFIREFVWPFSADQWWAFEAGDVPLAALAEVKRRWNVDEDRVALTGYSMGGFGTWNIGLRHWDRFVALAPMAGGFTPSETRGRNATVRALLDNARFTRLFIVHGERDTLVPPLFDRWSAERLAELKTDHTYLEVPGAGHVLRRAQVAELLPKAVQFLTASGRPLLPKAVAHTVLAAAHGFAGWVRVDEVTGAPATIEATWPATAGEPVDVRTTHVRRFSLFVPEGWAAPGAPVRVTVNGAAAEAVEADPLESLCESWRAREDRTRCFARRLTVNVPGAPVGTDY